MKNHFLVLLPVVFMFIMAVSSIPVQTASVYNVETQTYEKRAILEAACAYDVASDPSPICSPPH
ncbi:unnamed protein product [Cunninghamella blakesleeana]